MPRPTRSPSPSPVRTTLSRTSSGTFRDELHTDAADEWLKMTGALDTASASRMVRTDVCERSTIIPRRFISLTTSWRGRKRVPF